MNSQSVSRFLRVFFLLCLPASSVAQTPAPPAPAPTPAQATQAPPPSATFAAEPYVLKSSSVVITRQADGTGTDLYTNAIAIQSEAALRTFSVISLTYASQSTQAEFLYARVIHSDGAIQETPVSGAIEQAAPVTQQAPLYSDIKVSQLPIRSLRVGDTLEWQGRITTTHPEAPNQFWGRENFGSGAVALDQTIELHVPAGLHVTVWTNPRAKATTTESTQGGVRIVRWHHSDLQPTVGPAAEAFTKSEEKRLRTPEEQEDELKGALPSLAYTTFSDWASVGAWYRSLADGRITPDAAIKAKVAELTAGKASTEDKARAVYQYVSTQIRYVGVDFGIGRFQPHAAAEVFANQYGDCKDKHTLLASMLSVLGLQADPVLIGANIRFNPAVPAPDSFNHVITHLQLEGSATWLDATAEIGAWGALLYPIRDQQALVVPASGPAVIASTPATLPFPQRAEFSVKGSYSDDLTSDSEISLSLREDSELLLRSVLHSVSPASYGQFVQNLMSGMGFGGTTSDPAIENLDDPAKPLRISFHYHRVKEKDWGVNRVTATFMNFGLPYFTSENPPVSAIQLGSPRTEISTVEMQLPKGWTAQLPAEVHQHTSFANCDTTWSLKDGKLTETRSLTILQKQVPVADYKTYLAWFDASDASGVPFVDLFPQPKDVTIASADQPKAPAPASGHTPEIHDDAQAGQLVQKAFEGIRNMDLDTARKNLDEANKIKSTQRGLWAGYASVSQMLGKPTEANQNLSRELSFHPDEVQLYHPLELGQLQAGDTTGALATLRAWVNAAPETPDAALALSRQLASMKRYDEALKAAQDALARLEPAKADVAGLRIAAANAQIALGHKTEAASAVQPLLATLTDPTQINGVAYILSEAATSLPEAEQAMTRVLAQRDAATLDWTVSDNIRPQLAAESTMAAEWDTMGWILYNEHKYQDALHYIGPAHRLIEHQDVSKHLAALASALHQPALASETSQHARTFRLGASGGRHLVGLFTLLLAEGRVLDFKPDASATVTLPAETEAQLRAADLRTLFPPASKAHLIRLGFVNCHADVCELILNPVQ